MFKILAAPLQYFASIMQQYGAHTKHMKKKSRKNQLAARYYQQKGLKIKEHEGRLGGI